MGAPLPGNRIGVHPTVVSQVTAAVDAGIGIQDLFVPTFAWGADTIVMSRDRGGVHGDNDHGARFRFSYKCQNAVVGIVKIDPLEAEIAVVIFPKRRLGLIKIIEMLD